MYTHYDYEKWKQNDIKSSSIHSEVIQTSSILSLKESPKKDTGYFMGVIFLTEL